MKRSLVSLSALALAAGTLTTVTFTVASTPPAYGDHCDPAEQAQNQQNRQNRQGQQDAPAENPPAQQDQNQPPQDQQGQDQQGQEQAPPAQDPPAESPPAQDRPAQDRQGQDRQGADVPPPAGAAVPASPTEPPAPEPDGDQQGQDQGQDQDQDQDQQGVQEQDQRRNQDTSRRRPTRSPSPAPTDAPPAETPAPTESPAPGGDEEECADLGPFPEDFIDIRQVQRNVQEPRTRRGGSRGTFTSRCGTNGNGHRNPDNFIVAPGVSNGAHHIHDYVGNLSTDAFSTDQSLAAAGTTCAFGDRSTYFWPVLRDRTSDANADDPDGNVGTIMRARQVNLQFRGNPVSRVTAMPRFIRILTGDAKAATNGGANALAKWSCTGFTDRITTKYPLCPRGSQLVRILDFPSCWDGQNNDSANHRTHVLFPDAGGNCPSGTRAIPQLRMTLVYSTPRTPSFALDAFPEQRHNPVTDHADFANVMPERLMRFAVDCINRGRRC
ncbi:DUF1996 domain-containing protein [Streptosporangium sp. NPDC050855]|uniref:DUF1996 domain-containing protein n=1 Tax=Streptosporangium sp. NPDC050855 TaxID=3366194 RepID=UPI003798A1B1